MGKVRNYIISILLSSFLFIGHAYGQEDVFVRKLIALEFDSAKRVLSDLNEEQKEFSSGLLKLWSHAGHQPLQDTIVVGKLLLETVDPYDQLLLGSYFLFRSKRSMAITYLLRARKQFSEGGSVYQKVCDVALLHLYSRIIISGDNYKKTIDRFLENVEWEVEMAWYHIHNLTFREKILNPVKGDPDWVSAFNNAERFFTRSNVNKLLLAHFLKKKAVYLRFHEKKEQALEAFQLSTAYCGDNQFVHYMKFLNYLHISGLIQQLNLEGALSYIDSARMIWDPSDSITAEFNYNSVLAYNHYEPNKIWDSAYYAIKRMSRANLRRYFTSNNIRTREYREQVEAEQRETEILEQLREIENRNTLLIFISILSLLLVALVFTLAFTSRKIKHKNQRIEALIRELHHRVKNNLQVISSLLGLQSMKLEDEVAKKAVTEGKGRIRAMSLIHQKLYQNEEVTRLNIKEYLTNLILELAEAYGYKNAQFVIEAPEDPFDTDTTLPLGLIVNELATNSFKYAFKSVESPKLTVVLEKIGKEFTLVLADNGPGLPEGFKLENAESFGLKLVSLLIKQLKGRITYQSEFGAKFQLIFTAGEGWKA